MTVREELEYFAFTKSRSYSGYRYTPDIRVAALAALVELMKVEINDELAMDTESNNCCNNDRPNILGHNHCECE